MRFINDNYMPAAGTITAPKISIRELKDRFENAKITLTRLQNEMKFHGKFEGDVFLRRTGPYNNSPLVGYHTLENGFTFLGIAGYGANGALSPVFTTIYWDGNAIQAYTPIRGNCVNTDLGSFIGHAADMSLPHQWSDQLFDKLTKAYIQAGLIPAGTQTIDKPEVLEALYLMQFEVIPKTDITRKDFNFKNWYEHTFFEDDGYAREDLAFFNWDSVREDIIAAVQIK